VNYIKQTLEEYGLLELLKLGKLSVIGDGMSRATMRSLTPFYHICAAHSYMNLMKRTFEKNLEKFLPTGPAIYEKINQLILKADKAHDLDGRPISVNSYLVAQPVHEEDEKFITETRMTKSSQKPKYLPIKVNYII
jgi:hypothetical protein